MFLKAALNKKEIKAITPTALKLEPRSVLYILQSYFSFIGSEVISKVSMIIRHKGFKAGSYNHDIALLKLSKPIKYSSFVRPICLPKQGLEERVGAKCYVSGWGRISERGRASTVLQEARVRNCVVESFSKNPQRSTKQLHVSE